MAAPVAPGDGRRRKALSLGIALALEALIVLLLLTLGSRFAGREDGREVTTLTAIEIAAPPAPEPAPQPEQASAAATPDPEAPVPPASEQPLRPSPLTLNPQPAPTPPAIPSPAPQPSPSAQPTRPKSTIGARVNPNRGYGPVDTGNPRTAGDSERVGTMPSGEPLYAARWYREPTDSELAGYLSTAKGPGYALIACKVVPGYYVEDCLLIAEGPQGALIGRAVMAAAWQFRVRPARIGGREQFGTWVRIRIDYTEQRARP